MGAQESKGGDLESVSASDHYVPLPPPPPVAKVNQRSSSGAPRCNIGSNNVSSKVFMFKTL